jgi:hypothetical protein
MVARLVTTELAARTRELADVDLLRRRARAKRRRRRLQYLTIGAIAAVATAVVTAKVIAARRTPEFSDDRRRDANAPAAREEPAAVAPA